MSGTFDFQGISFLYPENWELIRDAETQAEVDASIVSPSGAMWSVQTFPLNRTEASLLDEAIASLKGEYPDLEAVPQEVTFADQPGFGYDLNFFCLDFLVTGRVYVFSSEAKRMLVLFQAENREFESILPVFSAITTSLLDNSQ